MISGVYKITNKINGKFYVGSSYDIFVRWTQHKTFKSHSSKKLFAAFVKYGIPNFTFEIIEELPNVNKSFDEMRFLLLSREQHYLDTLTPFGEIGYNLSTIAGSTLGCRFAGRRTTPAPYYWPEESKQRVSGEHSKKNVQVDRYDDQLNLIETHYNISDAAKKCNTTIQSIVRCCQGKNKTAGGFVWAYKDTQPISPSPHKSNTVIMFDLQGNTLATFNNAKDAARHINKSDNPIYKCCRGEQPTAHGYIWKWN